MIGHFKALGQGPFEAVAALKGRIGEYANRLVNLEDPRPGGAVRFAQAMARAAPNAAGVEVYGPADAPLSLVRGRRRKRFLVRADRTVDLSAYMATWRARVKPPAAVRVAIDIDPYSFL